MKFAKKNIAKWIIYADGRTAVCIGGRIITRNPIVEEIDIRQLDDEMLEDLLTNRKHREVKQIANNIIIKDLQTKKIILKTPIKKLESQKRTRLKLGKYWT